MSSCIDISARDEAVVAAAEPGHLALLRVRRHHQPHGLQRLDQEAADVGAALAHHARLAPRAARGSSISAQIAGGAVIDRHQEQPQVEPGEHADGADEEQHVADPRQRGLRGDALDLADVVVDARHDVAEPRARVEPRRQALQMAVHLEPHVEQDVRRHARVAQPADHVEHEAGDRDARRTARRCG